MKKKYAIVVSLFLFLFSAVAYGQEPFLETSASWSSYLPYTYPRASVTADLDRDGYLDLIVFNYLYGCTVHYSVNGVLNPVGEQQFSDYASSYSYSKAMAAADYDNDGMVEIAALDRYGRAFIMENNNGDLVNYGGWTNLTEGSNGTVIWADVTGDEYMDLIVGGGSYLYRRPARMYQNTAGALATTSSWTSAQGNMTSMAAGKIGTDSYVDLVIGDYNYFLRAYSTSGTKALQSSTSWSNYLGARVYDVALGDWDNDGKLDLAVAAQDGVYVFTNNRAALAGFGSSPAWQYSTGVCYSVAWGDVNRDGYLDLAVGRSGDAPIVFLNQQGSLGGSPNWTGNEEATTYEIILADMDNDMGLELVTGANVGGTSKVYKNISRLFSRSYDWKSSDYSYPDANGIDFADINKDGKDDLVVSGRVNAGSHPSRLFLASATNIATNTSWTPFYTNFRFAAPGDIDNDGDTDVVMGNSSGRLYLYRNTGTALPTVASWTSTTKGSFSDGTFMDFDGDGDLDLFVSDSSTTYQSGIFRNNSGVLERTNFWRLTSTTIDDIEWGDVDNDGDMDFVTTRGSTTRLFRNRNGQFSVTPEWSALETDGTYPGNISLADVDQDGYIDLIRANSGGSLRLYRNKNGVFEYSSSWSSAFAESSSSLKAVDVNNDGYPDIVLANNSNPGRGYRVYLNKKGSFESFPDFSNMTNISSWGGFRSVTYNDVDQDGDLDLFFSMENYGPVLGFKNNYAVKVRNLPNNPPFISRASNRKMSGGDIQLVVWLYDLEYDYCNVKAQYSLLGTGQWKDCTGAKYENAQATGSGLGNRITMTWNAAGADKVTAPFVFVRFILSSRNSFGAGYTDSAGPIMYASSIYQRKVTISTDAAPFGQIVSPFSGQNIRKGSTNQIEGSAYDFNFSYYILEIKTNSSAGGWTTITNSSVPVPPVGVLGKLRATQNPGFYKLRIRVYDDKNKVVYSSNIIRILDVPEGAPTVVKTYPPVNGTEAALNSVILAKFSVDMNEASLRADTLSVSAGGAQVAGSLDYNYFTKTLVFEPVEPLLPNTYYVVSVSSNFQTMTGIPLAVNFNWGFQTDSELTTSITQVSPIRGRNDVPQTTGALSVYYNRKIPSSYSSYLYLVDFESGSKVSLSRYWKTNRIDATISGTLKSNRIYFVRMTNSGTGVPAAWDSYFITGDNLQPKIVSNAPARNQQISLNGDVRVKFNKRMNDSSFRTNTFYVICSNNGRKLVGTREYNIAQDIVTFTPVAGSFTQGRTYIATLTPDVRDLGGLGLASQSNWSFRTPAPLQNPLLINPVHNSTNAALSGLNVFATFSSDIDASTLNSASFKLIDPNSKPIPGTLSLSNLRKVKLEPDGYLSQNTYYTSILTTSLKATNGTSLTNTFRWRFRTLSPIQSNQLSYSPQVGVSNVQLNSTIDVTFPSMLDSLTVNPANCALYYMQSGVSNFIPAEVYVTGGNVFTIAPQVNLPQNRVITIRLTTNIRVTSGAKLPRNVRYSFRTFSALSLPTNLSPINGTLTAPIVATTIRAAFKTNIDASSLNASTFYVKNAAGNILPGSLSVVGHAIQFVPDADQMVQNTYYTCVISRNLKSSALTSLSNAFKWSFRTVPPLVAPTNLSPLSLTSNVSLSGVTVRAGFPTDIDSSTLNASTFYLVAQGGGQVSGTLSVVNHVVQFLPDSGQLSQNTWYTSVITHRVESIQGTSMVAPYKWRFRTLPPLEKPTNRYPSNNSTNNPLTGFSITATFATNIDAGTLNSSTFSVIPASGTALPGTYSVSGKQVSFTPSVSLSHNTMYTCQISQSLRTYELTSLENPFRWKFRTLRPILSGSLALSPISGSSNNSLSALVSVTFPTNLETGTLNASTFFAYYIQGAVTNSVPAEVYITSSRIAQLQPGILLPQNTQVYVRLTKDVRTVLGTSLTNDLVWTFKTLKPLSGTASEFPINTTTNVPITSVVEAVFATNLNPATINDQTFFVKVGTNRITGTRTYDDSLKKITFTPAGFLPARTIYTAYCSTNVKTVVGTSLVQNKLWWFKTTSPLHPATNLTPLASASNLPLKNLLVKAVFKTNIDAGSVNSSSFYVRSQSGEDVLGSYSVAGKEVSFSVSIPLAHNTWYTSVLTPALKTFEKTSLTNRQSWRFKTLPRVPLSSVVQVSPLAGASNISTLISPSIRLTNAQALDSTTVNPLNISLQDVATGSNVVCSVLFEAGLNRVTMDPAVELSLGKWYRMVMNTNVKTSFGTSFLSNRSWLFKTASPYPIDVISSQPVSNQSGVLLNATLNVTFATNIDSSTITPSSFYLLDQAGMNIGGNRSVLGKTVSFAPSGGYLSQNTWYTLVVPANEVRYSTGIKVLKGKRIPFRTLSPLQNPTNLNPVNLSVGNPLRNLQIRAIFRTNIDAGTLNSASFFIRSQSGGVVPGEYSATGKNVVFSPAGILSMNTMYTAIITSGLKTYERTSLVSDYKWVFTTLPDLSPSAAVRMLLPVQGASNAGTGVNPQITLTNAFPLDASTVNAVNVTMQDLTTFDIIYGSVSFDAGQNRITFDPSADLDQGHLFKVSVSTNVRSVYGTKMTTNFGWTFKTTAPYAVDIISYAPTNALTNVQLNLPISVAFVTNIDSATLSPSSFYVIDQYGNYLGGSRSVSGNLITFTPAGGLLPQNTSYTVVIPPKQLKYVNGIYVVIGGQWWFKTAPALAEPTILSPDSGQTNVALTNKITARFSTNINPASLTPSSFYVMDQDGYIVSGSLSSPSPREIRLTPSVMLRQNTVYTAFVTSGLRSGLQTTLTNTFKWWFRTQPPVNQPAEIFPADGQNNLDISIDIYASFGVALLPETCTKDNFRIYKDGLPIPGSVSYDAGLKRISFRPSVALLASSTYTAELTKDVRTVTGLSMTNDFAWSFSTGKSIGKGGGAIQSEDAKLRIQIPVNAVSEDRVVTLSSLAASNIGTTPSGTSSIGIGYVLGPSGLVLKKPVAMTIDYSSVNLTGIDETKLALFQKVSGNWVRIGGTVNKDENILQVTVTTVGEFAVFEDVNVSTGEFKISQVELQPRVFSPSRFENLGISFAIGQTATVKVRIFSVNGRPLHELSPFIASAGMNTVFWNCKLADGALLQDGLYLVSIEAESGGKRIKEIKPFTLMDR